MTRFFGVLSTVFIIGFLAFGLREALRQKAAAKKDRGPPPP
jgi:preprotein translocase subunit SecG